MKMKTAKEIFTEVWKEWFGDEDNDQLYIALEHNYIFESMERYKQGQVEPVVMPEIADINKMKMFDIIQLNRDDEFMRVPNGYVLTIYRLDRNQMNSVFIPE